MPVWNIIFRASVVGSRNVMAPTAEEAKRMTKDSVTARLADLDLASSGREVTILSIMKSDENDNADSKP